FADAGALYVGVMKNFQVDVSDGLLTIDLLHVNQNPAIKGIEIIAIGETAPNELFASTSEIDFGSVVIGESATRTFVLSNNGGVNDPSIVIDPQAVTITGADASHFAISFPSTEPITLAPQDSITVTATFQPTAQALHLANLSLPHSGINTPLQIELSGQGTEFIGFNWTEGIPSPIPRTEAGGIVIDNKIYAFGGFFNTSLDATLQSHVFDPATDEWTRLADMPAKITHSIPVYDGNTVWLVAGFDGDNPGVAVSDVYKYDVANDSWSQGPSLPAVRGSGGTAIVGRQLHFFGGYGADRQTNQAEHWVLDLDNPTAWLPAADMPSARGHMGVAVFNDKIYAVGGQFGHDAINSESNLMHVYDPATDTWSQAASLPLPRSHHEAGTFVHDGHIFVVGGQLSTGPNSDDVSAYEIATDTWKILPTIPLELNGTIAAIINDTFYVTTGTINGGFNPLATTYVTPWSNSVLDAALSASLVSMSAELSEEETSSQLTSPHTQCSCGLMLTDTQTTDTQDNNTETSEDTLLNTESLADTSFSGYMSDTNPVAGNFQVVANIQNLISSGANPEVGILIQEPSTGVERFVQLGIQLDGQYLTRSFNDVNGQVAEKETGITGQFPDIWVLLQRQGDEVTLAVSSDDTEYGQIETITLPGLVETIEAGTYIDSGSENVEARATLGNFELIPLP
ncbi:MAG: Kelch repeat-containing protein, partial [Akkermansiaceae bacterium]